MVVLVALVVLVPALPTLPTYFYLLLPTYFYLLLPASTYLLLPTLPTYLLYLPTPPDDFPTNSLGENDDFPEHAIKPVGPHYDFRKL